MGPANSLHVSAQGHREGGRGLQRPRGPWTLGGPWARKEPIEISVKTFFFGDHLILTETAVRISKRVARNSQWGAVLGVWERSPQLPEAVCLGAEPQALEILDFFAKIP